jgi:hypothetical protein
MLNRDFLQSNTIKQYYDTILLHAENTTISNLLVNLIVRQIASDLKAYWSEECQI